MISGVNEAILEDPCQEIIFVPGMAFLHVEVYVEQSQGLSIILGQRVCKGCRPLQVMLLYPQVEVMQKVPELLLIVGVKFDGPLVGKSEFRMLLFEVLLVAFQEVFHAV